MTETPESEWEVCQKRNASASISIADNNVDTKIDQNLTRGYLAIYKPGLEDSEASPFDISVMTALKAEGVPKVREDIYVDPDGTAHPFFICKSVSGDRDPDNPYMFHITVEYEDMSGDAQEGQAPPAGSDPEDYQPGIKWSVTAKKKQVYSTTTANHATDPSKPYIMPHGVAWKKPLMADYPCLTAVVTQLESNLTTNALKQRMLTTNSVTWNGLQADTGLITDISYEVVRVPVSSGTAFTTAYRVRYVIEENPLFLLGMRGANTDGSDTANLGIKRQVVQYRVGWQVAQPLVDTKFKWIYPNGQFPIGGVNVDLVKNQTYNWNTWNPALTQGCIDQFGGPLLTPFNTNPDWEKTPPALKIYRIYRQSNWSFLQI